MNPATHARRTDEYADAGEPRSPESGAGTPLEWVKAIGMPLVTLLVTLIGGAYLTNLTKAREARESNERLYAELLTQRERSDAEIRKDMFSVVLKDFLGEKKDLGWNEKVLQLELLANNFSQSIDLTALFKDLSRNLSKSPGLSRDQSAELRKRLDVTASKLIFKQVDGLARRGYRVEVPVPLGDWESAVGKPFIQVTVPRSRFFPIAPGESDEPIAFSVEILGVDFDVREVEVRLHADFSDPSAAVDRHFWVGQHNFPMLENTQLSGGLRASVVMTDFLVPDDPESRKHNAFASLHLVVFPAASASFKERQDFDDILLDLLRTREAGPRAP